MERKVIFWDFDGTLIYSNESFLCSLSDAFEQFNYSFEQKEIKDFLVSVCSWYVPSKEYTDKTGELWWQELLGKLQLFCGEHHIKKSDSDLICKKFRENVIRFEYKLYEDAEEILSYCKDKGYDNYILSNNFPELVETPEILFVTIEQIVGRHFELDDFQIQSVTEGREAFGGAVVKLRSNGKLYSGKGISSDIIGASISAYINALNKIVYEEA